MYILYIRIVYSSNNKVEWQALVMIITVWVPINNNNNNNL